MERREKILMFISKYKAENTIAPTFREIGKAVELKSSSSVHEHLTVLKDEGVITYIEKSSRTLRLTEKGKKRVANLKEREKWQ